MQLQRYIKNVTCILLIIAIVLVAPLILTALLIIPSQINLIPNLTEQLTIPVGDTGTTYTVTPLELGYYYSNDDYLNKVQEFNSETSIFRRFYLYYFYDLNHTPNILYHESEKQKTIFESMSTKPVRYKLDYDWDTDEIIFEPSVSGTTYTIYCPKEFDKEKISIKMINEDVFWDLENPVILGTSSTQYTGELDLNRNKNMQVAVNKINGTILNPNEIYSMYKTISPFTKKEGYTEAGVIVGNEYSQALGGGVCQVTTTMYNAVLRSELNVIERHNHSTKVGYVAPGFDATIAGQYVDFKFRNQTKYPIGIFMHIADGELKCVIVGGQDNDKQTQATERNITFNTIYEDGVYTLCKYVNGKFDSIVNTSEYKE